MDVSHTDRIPPGQRVVTNFPVLHEGPTVHLEPHRWRVQFFGLIEPTFSLSWNDLLALPAVDLTCDLHCVTGWTNMNARASRYPLSMEGRCGF